MSAAAEQLHMKKNVRAGKTEDATLKDEYRWFHIECYQKSNLGYSYPIDFPDRARSDYTTCTVCHQPINEPQ